MGGWICSSEKLSEFIDKELVVKKMDDISDWDKKRDFYVQTVQLEAFIVFRKDYMRRRRFYRKTDKNNLDQYTLLLFDLRHLVADYYYSQGRNINCLKNFERGPGRDRVNFNNSTVWELYKKQQQYHNKYVEFMLQVDRVVTVLESQPASTENCFVNYRDDALVAARDQLRSVYHAELSTYEALYVEQIKERDKVSFNLEMYAFFLFGVQKIIAQFSYTLKKNNSAMGNLKREAIMRGLEFNFNDLKELSRKCSDCLIQFMVLRDEGELIIKGGEDSSLAAERLDISSMLREQLSPSAILQNPFLIDEALAVSNAPADSSKVVGALLFTYEARVAVTKELIIKYNVLFTNDFVDGYVLARQDVLTAEQAADFIRKSFSEDFYSFVTKFIVEKSEDEYAFYARNLITILSEDGRSEFGEKLMGQMLFCLEKLHEFVNQI